MNVPREDLTPVKRPLQTHIVFLWDDGHSTVASFPMGERITETLDLVSREWPAQLGDDRLQAAVVIEGFNSAQLYSASTFRWLCGVGPDPTGKDPSWMR